MKAADILKKKGSGVITINSNNTVYKALGNMIDNKVGSLVVVDSDSSPIGIITERDISRLVYSKANSDSLKTTVVDVMTENIVVGVPDDDLDYIMALMTQNRFRHVPIVEDGKLVGLVSIGDVVKAHLKNVEAENRYLSDYITGKYPA